MKKIIRSTDIFEEVMKLYKKAKQNTHKNIMLEMFKGGPRSFNIFILILFSSCYCYISTSVQKTYHAASTPDIYKKWSLQSYASVKCLKFVFLQMATRGAVGKKKSSYKSLGKFHLGPLIHNLRKHCPEEFMVSFAGFEACGIQYHVCFLNYGPEIE